MALTRRKPGAAVTFGEGGTPFQELLQMLRAKLWKIPANIEHEYPGGDPVAEVALCHRFCRQAPLAGGSP